MHNNLYLKKKKKGKKRNQLSAHDPTVTLAVWALASRELSPLERGELMGLDYLWLSGFQIDTINIQTLNLAGCSRC